MKYKSFRIINFKGIKDTTVDLRSVAGAGVFAFVGLNESGKTTVLEAIHSFSPDAATNDLLGGDEGLGVPFKDRVPRHLISQFTGNITVIATVVATDAERKLIVDRLQKNHGITIDLSDLPNQIVLDRSQKFENGDFKENYFLIRPLPKMKAARERKLRLPSTAEHALIRDEIYKLCPSIAYFPTFVFDFPKSIFLTDRGNDKDKFYRRAFQDILDYDGCGQTIEKDIISRVRAPKMVLPWPSFLDTWANADDTTKIQNVMDRAGAAVTKLVFGRWDKIFGESAGGKQVEISFQVMEGEVRDAQGTASKTQEHDVAIKFQVRDGTRRFYVNDRSLGFRWFFSFMLFTQFRVARSSSDPKPQLFLFDEPASNLHAAAQQKLIESFPEIAQKDHVLGYSTHSHYMIEPKWLEQTFIVTNRADAPAGSMLDEVSFDDESLDIQVSAYRAFVNAHPNQTSFFQPIIDRLDVVPSKFDMKRDSVVLEGKSDFYILRYAEALHKFDDLPLLPALGAGTFGALLTFHVGWNLNFLFVLDGDKKGKAERQRYIEEFSVDESRIVTLSDLIAGIKEIEDLLDVDARKTIQAELKTSKLPTKDQIRRFFQERLASGSVCSLGAGFDSKSRSLLEAIRGRLKDVSV